MKQRGFRFGGRPLAIIKFYHIRFSFVLLSYNLLSVYLPLSLSVSIRIHLLLLDLVDLLHLFGGCCNSSATLLIAENWGSGKPYIWLYICFGILPSVVFIELDLPILYRRQLLSMDCLGIWYHSNWNLLRFLLLLLHQVTHPLIQSYESLSSLALPITIIMY